MFGVMECAGAGVRFLFSPVFVILRGVHLKGDSQELCIVCSPQEARVGSL